jgi:hypothetical protein
LNIDFNFDNVARRSLCKHLSRLNPLQFKCFYGIFVHYWTNYKCFISKQNLFNLWCELNQSCHESDESFPDRYDDREEIKDFCQAHPYYFIDVLPTELIASLFAEYVDDRIDVLTCIAKSLYESDIRTAYIYANTALGLHEPVDVLAQETQNHIKHFS